MNPETLLARYFVELQMNNWSLRTIDRRRYSLGRFVTWCADRGIDTVTGFTDEVIQAYRRSLFHHRNQRTGQPIKFATQASYLTAARHWLGWLVDGSWIAVNPAEKIELPKEEHRLPSAYLTLEEVETLLGTVDLTTATGLRDRAIMETFYSTGMRRSELIALKLDDIDRERGLVIILQGKGRKDRVVPIGQRALGWVNKYTHSGRPAFTSTLDVLFLTGRGNSFHPVTLSQLVRDYLDDTGITKRGICHMIRHMTNRGRFQFVSFV